MVRYRAQLTPKFLANPFGGSAEYHVYPPELKEPYRSRRHKNGDDLYRLIDIPREDKAARHRQFAQNYDFFGAPVGMFFFLDRSMGPPQWSDLGMLIQNIMLLARERLIQPVRLIGVSASTFRPEARGQLPLLDPAAVRREQLARAVDRITGRFGRSAIVPARLLDRPDALE